MKKNKQYAVRFKEVKKKDIPLVGGKNASLGEMITELKEAGVRVPPGFALTTDFYWRFLKENDLQKKLEKSFEDFDPRDLNSLQKTGRKTRRLVREAEFSEGLKEVITENYRDLCSRLGTEVPVAVRSSGVAEDAPEDSFAGEFETYLNVRGEKDLLKAVRKCLASSFNDRVIAYREEKEISHLDFALSVGVQKMVRSGSASSGVMFTLDTETGFSDVVLINSVFGVGEMIVKGKITPDQFYVHKPTLKKGYRSIITKNLGEKTQKLVYDSGGGLKGVSVPQKRQLEFSLTDEEVLTLSCWACAIEDHYGSAQDIEWAKDGETGQLFIVQSRPETVHTPEKKTSYKEYAIKTKKEPLLTGIAVGDKIGRGRGRVIRKVENLSRFERGEVLITEMTDPDWVPAMRIAAAIVTDEGGKTAHAAIISRELGIPCIVATERGSEVLKSGKEVTVDCTQGLDGRVFEGRVDFEVEEYDLEEVPDLETEVMVNIGAPEIAFKTSFLPVDGVGLAREEFIIAEKIRVHPLALYHFDELEDKEIKKEILELTVEHEDKKEYFVKELAEGVAQIGAAFYPREVIVRFSDFKTSEYRNLIGGWLFEEEEPNPMLGFRGAARYVDKKFQPAFRMECEAIKRARKVFGLENISVMIPFCRTVKEAKSVLGLIEKFGLERAEGLKVYGMAEVPSNAISADEFLNIFDGYSIGTNDLTQLLLGVDRDNAKVAPLGDAGNEAVKKMVRRLIKACNKKGKYSGICGQAPSDSPEFARFLIEEGIKSISLNPGGVLKTIKKLAE